jgi:elongation factor G
MNTFDTKEIRNVVLCSHGGAGKTTWIEAVAYNTGAIEKMGTISDGTTIADFDPDEAKRGISISMSVVPVVHKETKINIIDTPGFFDFLGEALSGIRAADSALIFVDVLGGVQVGTERMWQLCEERNLPRIIVVNKMDRENASFDEVLDQITEKLTKSALVLTFPWGEAEGFKGVVDVVSGKAYTFSDNGKKMKEEDIPADLVSKRDEYYSSLVEVVVETDEALMEAYLEDKEPTPEQLTNALNKAIIDGIVYPIMTTSGQNNIGVTNMLDSIVNLLPSSDMRPAEKALDADDKEIEITYDKDKLFSAFVFKTSADPFVGRISYYKIVTGTMKSDIKPININKDKPERISAIGVPFGKKQEAVSEVFAGDIGVLTKLTSTLTNDTLAEKGNLVRIKGIDFPKPVLEMAMKAKTKSDEDKIGTAIKKLIEEDPSLAYRRTDDTRESLLGGLGEAHLQASVQRLSEKFGVNIGLEIPKIPYRETITKTIRVQGRHKKQTGGHGQFGDCWCEVKPLPRGEGFKFTETVFGGSIPKNYIPAIEKGWREAILEGRLAGFPVVDIHVNVDDGSYHPVDSSEMAFKMAANLAYRKSMEESKIVILEPIYKMTITVPEQYMGDIMGDISSKRGRILGSEVSGHNQIINAEAPLYEVQRYAIDLNQITGGRGNFFMEFDHYEIAPPKLSEDIVAKQKAEKESQG